MRTETGRSGQNVITELDSDTQSDDRVFRLAQRPHSLHIAETGTLTDTLSEFSVLPLTLRQRNTPPLSYKPVSSLMDLPASNIAGTLTNFIDKHIAENNSSQSSWSDNSWSESSEGDEHFRLEQEILHLTSPAGQAGPASSEGDEHFRLEQEILHLTSPAGQANPAAGAFEAPRSPPTVPELSAAGSQYQAGIRVRNNLHLADQENNRIRRENTANRFIRKILPPVSNKLHKDPPPHRSDKHSVASRIINKVAPPVRNRLRKEPPELKTTGEKQPAFSFLTRIAAPVRNKLHKTPPEAAVNLPTSKWSISTVDEQNLISRFLNRCSAAFRTYLERE